jgi:hypothetical protein
MNLGEHAAHGAAAVFAVDGIEGERDGDERQQEAEKRHEGRQRFLRGGEQAEEQERVLANGVLDLADGAIDRPARGEQHQQHDEMHAGAGEMIRGFLERNRGQAGER